jgi:hypothetical protein
MDIKNNKLGIDAAKNKKTPSELVKYARKLFERKKFIINYPTDNFDLFILNWEK